MAIVLEGDGTITGVTTFTTPLDDISFDSINVTGIVTASTFQAGTGVSMASPRAQNIALFTNNVEGLTLDDAGRLGIGISIPNQAADANNVKVVNAGIITANQYYGNQLTAAGSRVTGVGTFENGLNITGNITNGLNVSAGIVTVAGAIDANGALDVDGQTDLDVLNVSEIATFAADVSIADKIIHTGDTNTAIRFPSADTVTVETGGTERLSIGATGNININGEPPLAVTGGDWRNLSLSGQTASSSGFIWLGNGAAATNADLDLGRVNFVNGPTLVSQIAGSTQTAANDDGRLTFSTKATGGTLTERIRIDSSGRLLVGKTSGTNIVDILATDSYLRLTKAAVTNYCGIRLDRDASDNVGAFLGLAGATDNFITGSAQHDFCIRSQANILFGTNGAWPAARFTVGGQFLIGHDTVIGHNGVDGYLQVTGTGTDSSSVNLNRFSADNWCPFLTFGKSRNATKGSHTIVQDNDYLAYINFAASDGVDFNNTAAYIAVKVDGTPGTDDTPGRIEFATCPDGTNAATTRTTIDNAGATLFSGLTGNTDTRNTQGIAVKSPHGVSFNAFGGNGSRNWRIRPDDLNGWADLDLSCAPTDGAADWPDAATDTVLSLQGDTKDAVVSNGNLKIGVAGKGIMFHPHDELSLIHISEPTRPY